MVTFKEILAALEGPAFSGDASVEILGLTHDSRRIHSGWIFVAIPGQHSDGHAHIGKAVAAGAAGVIAEIPRPANFARVPWITIADTRKALGKISEVVYGLPTRAMKLVGITGTNGKTTITFLLEAIIRAAGGVPGVVGTISYRWGGHERPAAHTTPEASDLQEMFAHMVRDGVTHAIMEVSSHGLHLGRLDGCHFDIGCFTNLTQDHLDYHGNFEDYFLAKQILFKELLPASSKEQPIAVVNLDDPYGRRLAQETDRVPVIGYGHSDECRVKPREIAITSRGIRGSVSWSRGTLTIDSLLTGSFNLENILAAVAVADTLGIPEQAVREGLREVQTVPGRLERVPSDRGVIFVDYAHTPNALKNVLDAVRVIRKARVITVMGCGGDRDKGKRPLMGREAAAGSDFVVVTSDNPRTEDPLEIVRQVEEGVRDYGFQPLADCPNGRHLIPKCYLVISDRREAIAWAVEQLQPEDILLVAGKGHETYQEIHGVRYPFDDREVIRDELQKRPALTDHGEGRLNSDLPDVPCSAACGRDLT